MNSSEMFTQIYKKAPQHTAFTPYRICPIGAHSDHQLGKITGFAIDKGIHIAYGPKENGVIEIQSVQFEKGVVVSLGARLCRRRACRKAQKAA